MISVENIQLIEYDLHNAGVDYLPLQQELVDHICMDVEREIEKGGSFVLAYQNIKHQYIDDTNLIELQYDAKTLLDYKSVFLKRVIIIVSSITVIGFLLKTFRIPGSNWIQFVSILLLGVLFYKIGFYLFQDKRQKNLKMVCSISLFIVGVFLPIAYVIFSFFPNLNIIATKLNMISYLLLSLSLTVYFSSVAGLNIFGITTDAPVTDLFIASVNLCLAVLALVFLFGNFSIELEYLLFIILGGNVLLVIYYLLIKHKFINRLISLLIISAIIMHLYHLPFFMRGIFN